MDQRQGKSDLAEARDVAVRFQFFATRLLRLARSENSKDGIGSAQYSALAVLYERGPMSVVDLARVERVTHPTMSRIISGLEKLGAVARQPDPADRRQRHLLITSLGRALYENICNSRTTAIEAVLSRLSPDAVNELLHAVTDVLGAVATDGKTD